jgi:type IV pilus assembly protein PilC
MLKAGLPISRALIVLERQTRNPGLKKIISHVREEISKGKTLSEAMSYYPKIFSSLFVSVVKAGEESGGLVNSLYMVANQLERNYYIKKKVKGAMLYPAVIMTLIVIVGAIMLIYVVPKILSSFAEMNVTLPASTRFLIWLSSMMQKHYLLLLLVIIIMLFGFRMAFRMQAFRYFFDRFIISVPIIGEMVKEMNSARTARTLSSLLSAGVDVVSSLDITSDVLQNSAYKAVLQKAKENIKKGGPMSESFAKNERLYPSFFTEMMSAGEETGNMSGMLAEVGTFYENEIDQKTKDFSSIIEPVIMIFMGLAVGFFAYAMLTPMYSLMGSIQ